MDYCSGALLATRRSLFEELGGFDERFCPAYYEDTDYCLQVKAAGLRTVYKPASRVIHWEGASSGTRTAVGVKRYTALKPLRWSTGTSKAGSAAVNRLLGLALTGIEFPRVDNQWFVKRQMEAFADLALSSVSQPGDWRQPG